MRSIGQVTAFVTDGNQRPALAITRSLGRRGMTVVVGEEATGSSLASASRYCARRVVYPSPYSSPEQFSRFMLDFVKRERIDVLFPVTDVTTAAIAEHQSAFLRHTALAVPSFAAFDTVSDKWNLLARAAACGIPIPRTHLIERLGSLEEVLGRIEYPVVVKPTRSRQRTPAGWRAGTAHHVHSEAELIHLYRQAEYLAAYPSLIQERISGPGMGVFVLCDRGRLRAAFAHRRLRERPPSGGVSVLCESARVDSELCDQAMRLLGPLEWHGVAMVEYKENRRTGEPVLMEVNGRFWGSLQLAVDAGVDFPYLVVQLATGQPLDIPDTYKIGVRSRWSLGDLDHLWMRLFRTDRDLPKSLPSRAGAIRAFLDAWRLPDLRDETFRGDDLRPAVFELRQYLKNLTGSGMHRLGKALMSVGRSTTRSGDADARRCDVPRARAGC